MTSLNRRALLGLLASSALTRGAYAAPRTLADSDGRNVAVPERVSRVLAAGPPASILLYVLAPDAMIGWVPQPGEDAKPFLLPQVRDLPATPRLTLRDQSPNLGAVAALKPDLILDFGSIGGNYVTLANKVQAETHVPYALIDGHLDKLPRSLRLAGDMLGRAERGNALAAYVEQSLAKMDTVLAKVPAERRPRFFLARGSTGLQSAVKGSGLTEVLERAGGINVAQGPAGRGGAIEATFDKLADWKPDVIVTFDRAAADAVRNDDGWKKIAAGRRVLIGPTLPWGWLGEPPSLNQIVGVRWLASAFYPDESKEDLVGDAREFHRLFYGVTPSDAQLATVVEGAR
ncbi:MAG: ABC transporter substrate-binding protein [Proteobacteria bacterium]|nr:ABC transporter substrate-binding protein [Pseudomonadota bacterium]